MTLDTLIMLFGALVAAIPVMGGLPLSIERPVLFVLGVCIVAFGVVVRRRSVYSKEKHSTYIENVPSRATLVEEMSIFEEHESA